MGRNSGGGGRGGSGGGGGSSSATTSPLANTDVSNMNRSQLNSLQAQVTADRNEFIFKRNLARAEGRTADARRFERRVRSTDAVQESIGRRLRSIAITDSVAGAFGSLGRELGRQRNGRTFTASR